MVAGVLKLARRAPTQGAMRLPSPRRAPRLGNVRLSVKLGLSFGAILALTAAIIAVDVHNVQGLEQAHQRVTHDVVPRIIAAQQAEAAFSDLHFAQTAMVLTRGAQRADEMDDLDAARRAVTALRKTRQRQRLGLAAGGRHRRDRHVEGPRRQALRRGQARRHRLRRADRGRLRGRRRRQRDQLDRALHHPGQPRPGASRRALRRRCRTRPSARRIVLGALALLAALALAVGMARHLGRRLRAALARRRGARRGRRRPRADRARAATRSGAPPAPWPRWSSTSARWPAPPTASPPET